MKKKLFIFLGILSVIIASGVIILYIQHYSVVDSHKQKRELEYIKIEDSFIKNPNIKDGGYLIEYYFEKENYEKALNFANTCIKLGASDTPVGFYVNFNMARIYYKLKNIEMARRYLKIALELDKENIIKDNNLIEKVGLQDLINPG
jgi:tetratricopeptide (TPR) repeat protein